jgi:hypothetical protein
MTTQDTKVDWGAPIEAVHEATGDSYPAQTSQARSMTGRWWVTWPGNATWADAEGILDPKWVGWRIRNVAQPTPTNEVRERMEAGSVTLTAEQADMLRKVLRIAARQSDEAAKLLALLDPVDGDLAAMREDAKAAGWHDSRLEQFEAGLLDLWKRARGRALAEAGK